MGVYDNDPRVARMPTGEYWLPDGDQRWRVVRRVGDVWHVYDQYGQWYDAASNKATADEAIRALIGDPR